MSPTPRGALFCILFALPIAPLEAQNCSNSSVGLVPLNDLGTNDYLGFEGGLYPDGSNERPARHERIGRSIARKIRPLDATGAVAGNGKIGLVSIGFSTTKIAWESFLTLANGDPDIGASVVLANCAVPNQDANDISSPSARYWTYDVPLRLALAGLAPQQVEVVWMLEGDRYIKSAFPSDAERLERLLAKDLAAMLTVLPNVKIVYLSTHTYIGYSIKASVHEPIAYDEAFSVKWLIERQISGETQRDAGTGLGQIEGPWLAWGPMIWTDGVIPQSSGLTWECQDVQPDGAHPSPHGAKKIADLLMHQFKSDPTAMPWFRADRGTGIGPAAFVDLFGDGTTGALGVPQISASELPTVPSTKKLRLDVDRACPRAHVAIALGLTALRDGGLLFGGGQLHVEPLWWLSTTTDWSGHGSYVLGPVPADPRLDGLELYAQAAIDDPFGPDGTVALTRALELRFGQ